MAKLIEALFAPIRVVVQFFTGIWKSIVLYYQTVIKISPFITGLFTWIPPVFQGLLFFAVTMILIKIVKDII